MNQLLLRTLKTGAMLVLVATLVVPAVAQTVNVTFRVNTATNLDTLGTNGVVQLRGALLGGDGNATREGNILPGGGNISWSSASSLVLQNVGGDYWSGTFELNANDTLTYKLWTGFDLDNGTSPGGGWEGPFDPSNGLTRDTRTFITGSSDTTLDLQFYHPDLGTNTKVDQYFSPFASKPDTVGILFRVNMAGVTEAELFDPAVNGPVGVRGDNTTSGGVIDWGATKVLLTREVNNIKNDHFWSGIAYIPKSALTPGSTQAYKFFVENNGGIDWEGGDNRTFKYSTALVSNSDTTLHWDNFDRRKPTGKVLIDALVTFRVNTEALEKLNLFDRSVGDEINVIGPKGFDVVFGQPDDFIHMAFNPLLQEWAVSEPFRKFAGDQIVYKFFVRWHESRVDPASPNFIPNLIIRGINDTGSHQNEDSGWEEPAVTGGADRKYTYTSDTEQLIPGDFGFPLAFFNSIPGNGIIPDPITVIWNVNMAPAADAATNDNVDLFTPGTDQVFIRPDGSLFAFSQGFTTFGANIVELSDPDGDMVYSGSFTTTKAAPYQLEFIIAYSTTGGTFITNGGGVALGRRYYQFIQPVNIAADLTTTWPTESNLPTIDWVQRNLPFQPPPDLTKPTSVDGGEVLPFSFALDQNYPNPFNPGTTIRYHVPEASEVKIQIFNLKGQVVKTLLDQRHTPGTYTVVWNGDSDRGQAVSTGVYFVKMQAGQFKQVRKMTFIR